jgi:hypothetical protein
MYRLTTGNVLAGEPGFPSVVITRTATSLGPLSQSHVEVGLRGSFAALAETTTADGTYFALDGRAQMEAGAPIQPLFFTDASDARGGSLHGALFTGGTYTDRPGFDPLIAQPVNEYREAGEPAFTAAGWHPAVPFAVRGDEAGAGRETLVALLGQYRNDNRTERLYDRLAFDLFYSTSPDRLSPTIGRVSAAATGGLVRVKVAADDFSGIYRVVVAYTAGGGSWASVDLTYDGAMRKWVGHIPAGAAWFVQAVDRAGNVAVAHNKGNYFTTRWGGEGRIYLPTLLKMRNR